MLRRAKQSHKLMAADRLHLHHTLIDNLGLSPRQTLIVLAIYASGCAGLGLILEAIPEYLSLLCYFLLFCGHCLFVIKSEAIGRAVGSMFSRPGSKNRYDSEPTNAA
jgi:UDP-GlcNAc:undecaprenyl-phosphate GlcNAc-1-phosphate transferase